MRYTFIGKNLDLTENFQNKIKAKLERVGKLVPEDVEAVVKLTVIKLDNKAEVTVKLPKRILRAEVTKNDMMAAIDEIVDILESQLVRYKSRLKDKAKQNISFGEELSAFADSDVAGDESIDIIRTKHFVVKPMDAEEAVMEMELLGHSFFVFCNAETDEIAVVYKRKDGKYGLIEPEF